MAADSDVEVSWTDIEAHDSLDLGGRYHGALRNTFRKLKAVHPSIDKHLAFACVVEVLNDSLSPEGLVPSLLLFGEYPELPFLSAPQLCTLQGRKEVAELTSRKMEFQMAFLCRKRALKDKHPTASSQIYEVSEKVHVWRERQVTSHIGE